MDISQESRDEEINIRTYTKWINSKLAAREPKVVVKDLIEDLQDGRVLLALLEVLLKIELSSEKVKFKIHKINNVNKALTALKKETGLKLHGITRTGIVDGNKTSILGLIWIIILHFQIHCIVFEEEEKDEKKTGGPRSQSIANQAEVEQRLINWVQDILKGFSGVINIGDVLKSWQDGLAFVFLLFVFRPSAVDVEKAKKMAVIDRLDYVFSVAQKEFQVYRLLEPTDVEQGKVDKKAVLLYLSTLYEALSKLEPAVVETTSQEPSVEPGEEEIVIKRESGLTTLRIGDEVIEITTVSTNKIVLQYKTIYYQVFYTIKRLEAKMEKIRNKEPSQESALALRNIQKEMQELEVKIKELNETNRQMAKEEGVDRQEFSEIQSELGELSNRWSTLIKQNNEESKRQPKIVTYRTSTSVVPGGYQARLTIGDEVIEITTVSTNEIVINYKIIYYQIITIIKLIESNMKTINEEEPSQKTARLLDENKQRMEQLQPKITELNELMAQMKDADGVDADELSDLQSELSDFDTRLTGLTEDISNEEKRQPKLTARTVYTVTTTIVDGGRTARLRDGDKVIEFKTVSTNEIVIRYKILYYEIITIITLIESNMKIINDEERSHKTVLLLQENKQRMEQLQPKITELNELMAEMKDADGVDANELTELQSELSDFNTKKIDLIDGISKEEKRQPPISNGTGYKSAPARHATVKYGDEVMEITTVSTNEIVIRYKILYYEIITLIRILEANMAQIKAAPASNTTAVMSKQNQDQMNEIQSKILELRELRKNMDGAEGVDRQELADLQDGLDTLDSRWTTVTTDIESEVQRISDVLDSIDKEKASLDEWRNKCETIGDWMDSIEDKVEVLESGKPSSDVMRVKQQMDECDALQETIKSDKVPTSVLSFGEEIVNEPSIDPDKKSNVKKQITEIKKVIGELSDRVGAAKDRYKRAIDKLEVEKKQKLANLKKTYQALDKQINILKEKDDKIGKVEGDPAAVRAKETLIELLVSDIQVFQPHFDDFRQNSWEVLEDPATDQSESENLQKQVTSLEERWGSLIRSVYSRSEAAKSLISKLPQGGVLEELIIVENRHHDYNLDWSALQDLFGPPEGDDQASIDDHFYRKRLMRKWKRECRELDEALSDVERETSELGEILDDSTKAAMQKAKMEVIRHYELKKAEKEYNDLPEYAQVLLGDPKLTEEDHEMIQSDLDAYKIRYEEIFKLVSEKDEDLKKQQPPKSTLVVTESYVAEEKLVPGTVIISESFPDFEPQAPSNAEEILTWWDDERKVVEWIDKVEDQLKQVDNEPASSDLLTIRRQHADIERITQEIGHFEADVTLLEKKATVIIDDPVTRSEDRENVSSEIKTVKRNWDHLKEKAFKVERRLTIGKKDLQKLEDNQKEYEVIISWIISNERHLQELKDDSIGNDEALKKRRLIILRLIAEITTYRIRLLQLIQDNEDLAKKDAIPAEDRDKLAKDTKDLEKRLDDLNDDAKNEESSVNDQLDNNTAKLNDWQKKADELDEWFITTQTEIRSFKVPPTDKADKERQEKYLEDFAKQKPYSDGRVNDVVLSGRELVKEGVVPAEKREKFEFDLESIPGSWDSIVKMADESKKNLDKSSKISEEYDDWSKNATEIKEVIEKKKQEVETYSQPTSDPEERKAQITIITKFIAEKPKLDDRVEQILSRAKELRDDEYLTPEQKEHVTRESRDIEVNWNKFSSQLDDAKTSVRPGIQNITELSEWRKEYTTVIKWIEMNEKKMAAQGEPGDQYKDLSNKCTTLDEMVNLLPTYETRVVLLLEKGDQLAKEPSIDETDRKQTEDDSKALRERWDKLKKDVEENKKRVSDAALEYFNEALNECSINVIKMQETAKSLRPPANNLPGVRVQLVLMKSLEKRLGLNSDKVQDIEEKVKNMQDAGVLARDGFAGTLNERCNEVRKEQQSVNVSVEEAKSKLHRALLNQLNRTQNVVSQWLKLCENKERNIDVANVKDLDKAHQECLKLKQAKAEFDKGEPTYITLSEAHKEAVDDGILVDKKAVDFDKLMEGLTGRHDELKKRLDDKQIELLSYVRQSTADVLNSAEEKLEEQKTWLQPEEPADNFPDAKEQQDTMKERESTIKERLKDVIVQLRPVEKIGTGEILPLPESTVLQRRASDVKTRFSADISAAKKKSQKIQEGYDDELLKKEIEKRKAWLDDHEGHVPETATDFKDFNEFKVKYDENKDFAKELKDNNILVLLEEAEKIDGIEPELKEELKELNERWDKLHDATKDKTDWYEDLMTKWAAFRKQQLTFLNWIDEKDAEAAGSKDQVNLTDEDEVSEYIQFVKNVKENAEVQGLSREKKLKEAGEDLVRHLGDDSPAAVEINKQVEEVDSCRKGFINDMGERIEKIESSEQKTRDLYNDMEDVTTWLDTTEELIDKYETREKEAADDSSREQGVPVKPQEGAVEEELVHVAEQILVKHKEIPERELQLNNAVVCVQSLDGLLDEATAEKTVAKINNMKDRWTVITRRLDDCCALVA